MILATVPPAPGSIPMKVPRKEQLLMRRKRPSTSLPVFHKEAACPFLATMEIVLLSTTVSICVMEKMPIMTTTISKPCISSIIPIVKRGSPAVGSMPTVLTAMPMSPPSRLRNTLPGYRVASADMPSRASQKKDSDPNLSPAAESGSKKKSNMTPPNTPPYAEAISATSRARLPSPFRVIW